MDGAQDSLTCGNKLPQESHNHKRALAIESRRRLIEEEQGPDKNKMTSELT